MRHRVALAARLGVAGALVYWLISSGRLDFRELGDLQRSWPWVGAAFTTLGCQIFLGALRWHLLLQARGVPYSRPEATSLTLMGWFFNQMVIGTTGGDLFKAYAIARERPDQRRDGIVSVFVDRAVGLLVIVILVAGFALVNLGLVSQHGELVWIVAAVWIVLLSGVALGCVYFSRRLRAWRPVRWLRARVPMRGFLQRIDEAVFAYRFHVREIVLAFGLSFVIHSLMVVTNLLLARALFDGPLPWPSFFLLLPLASLIASIPVNPPGALGTAEALYAYLLGLVGLTQGGLVCVLQRLGFYLWAVPGAVLYIARKRRTGAEGRAVEMEREPSS